MKKFKFTINGNIYNVRVKSAEHTTIKLEVNGTPYTAEIETEKPVIAPRIVATKESGADNVATVATPAAKSGGYKVKSPLPGSIVRLATAVGQTVKIGDTLLVMESMKMENNILAEKAGTVSKINVNTGQAVLQDDILLEIE